MMNSNDPPPKKSRRTRGDSIETPCTPEFKAEVYREAEARNMKGTEFVRYCIDRVIKTESLNARLDAIDDRINTREQVAKSQYDDLNVSIRELARILMDLHREISAMKPAEPSKSDNVKPFQRSGRVVRGSGVISFGLIALALGAFTIAPSLCATLDIKTPHYSFLLDSGKGKSCVSVCGRA